MGFGLGWGYGAAIGSKYLIVESEFEQERRTPGWMARLSAAVRSLHFERSHQDEKRREDR